MMFTTILFDFDYTLADSSDGAILCFRAALSEMGHAIPSDEAIRATIGLSLADSYRQLTGDGSPENARRLHELFVAAAEIHMVAGTRILPGVPEALALLDDAGYRMGVLSTKYSRRIRDTLAPTGLSRYFGVILGGEDLERTKPDPEGMFKAMAALDADPATTLYVGDSPTDGQTCVNAGLAFCAVLTGVTPRDQLEAFEPWYVAEDALDLARHLTSPHRNDTD